MAENGNAPAGGPRREKHEHNEVTPETPAEQYVDGVPHEVNTSSSGKGPELSDLGRAALGYAKLQLKVFPVHGVVRGCCTCGVADCPHPGKHPRTKRGFHDATTDMRQIEWWWAQWPSAKDKLTPQPVRIEHRSKHHRRYRLDPRL